jgi:hypothetical protein
MSRSPKPIKPNQGYAGTGRALGDPPAVPPYPLRRGGKATPDRSEFRGIGPACVDTDVTAPAARIDPESNRGPQVGPIENVKTRQEHGDMMRESRGVRTRPVRPGQHR